MSLWVSVHLVDPATGELIDDPRVKLASQLGGFEEWRTSIWGSEAVRRRDPVFLPQLAEQNLFVYASELPAFLAACRTLLSQASEIADELKYWIDEPSLVFRLANFAAAAEAADPEHGVVSIG